MDIAAETILGERYLIKSKLGAGAMGEVYLVEDLLLSHDKRAIKILHSHIAQEIKLVQRFRQEMRLASKLSHPNIVRFYDFGELPNGQYFITMEYFQGSSLADLLDYEKGNNLSFNQTLTILYYLAGALFHMHRNNIVHRDLKPGNVLIGANGEIKLTDLGIARSLVEETRITGADQMIGTPPFMAPELFVQKEEVTYAIDVYALGILAYTLASGKLPFQCASTMEYLRAHLFRPIPQLKIEHPTIPEWFQKFVETCVAKKPENRYQSMAEVAKILHKAISKIGIEVLPLEVLLGGYRFEKDKLSITNLISHTHLTVKKTWSNINQNFKNLPIAIIICLTYLLLFIRLPAISWSGMLENNLEYRLMDMFFKLRGTQKPPENVVIVSITDRSFEELGEDSTKIFPRRRTTELLQKLAKFKPKKILLDFRYFEKLDPAVDRQLAESFTLSPTYIAKFKATGKSILDQQSSSKWLMPNDEFATKATGIFDGTLRREDGVVRSFVFNKDDGQLITPFAKVLFGEDSSSHALPKFGDFINFYGTSNTIKTLPIHELLIKTDIPEDFIKDKIIFVGAEINLSNGYQTNQQPDSFTTPLGTNMYGVEIHSTIVANLLDGSWIRSIPLAYNFFIGSFFAIILSLIIWGLSNYAARIFVSVFSGICFVASYFAFLFGWHLPLIGLIYVAVISLIAPRNKNLYERATQILTGKS